MLPGLLYLTLAMGPSVAVEVAPAREGEAAGKSEDSMESLRSWLVQRLIEEGVTIAPSPDRADRVVRLHDTEDAVIVETEKEEHRVEHGPPAVMRLEVLHRARLVIEAPDEEGPAATRPSDAVIGMRSIGEAPPGFEGALESQLLSAGYVLTPKPRAGDPVLCVNHDKVAVAVSLTTVGATCGDPTIRLTYTQIQSPGGVDPIVEAVRGKKVEVEPVPQERPTAHDLPERADPTPPPKVVKTKPRRREPWSQDDAEVRIGAEGGLAARGAVDGSVRAFIRMGITPGPGAMLHVAVVPSGAGRSIRAVDTTLAAGPDVHLRRKRFGFDAGLVAGANIHAYQVDLDRGGRVTWYLGVPLSISLGRQFGPRVHLFTEAAMAGIRPVEHVSISGVRWTRAAWLVRAGLGVSFGWRIL